MFIFTSPPGVSQTGGPQYEQQIDRDYLDAASNSAAWRLESYRATTTAQNSQVAAQQLRCYFL